MLQFTVECPVCGEPHVAHLGPVEWDAQRILCLCGTHLAVSLTAHVDVVRTKR